jgi:hypothetical protein
MNVVADAVSGWVAAWYDGVVKGVQERCPLDQDSLVFLHRALDGQEHAFMSADFVMFESLRCCVTEIFSINNV